MFYILGLLTTVAMTRLFGFIFFQCCIICAGVRVWPQGTYALPKAVSGCPLNWQEGWIHQDLENESPKTEFSHGLQSHMSASLSGGDVKRSFCVKTVSQIEERSWPPGSYCLYKKDQCPTGLTSGFIKWDEEDTKNNNIKSGILPSGTFDDNTKIEYCCQVGSSTASIELPVEKPFYLLPHNTNDCQRVKGAISTLEYIVYDTEEENNHDEFNQDHVFTNKEKGLPKIYYCYYEGCQEKLQKNNGTISTANFPNYQYCSWSMTVNRGYVVSLAFTSITIPSCDGNYISIHDGLDETAPVILSLCGNNATSGTRLRSTGNKLFVGLRSGQNALNSGSIQFRADFKATTPFSGLSWPSGTYSLPKTTSWCPDTWIPGWRMQIMEDDKGTGSASLSPNLTTRMNVSLVGHALKRHFCTRTVDNGKSQTVWPAGNYCIYKKNHCPLGMKEGFIKWDDEDSPSKNSNAKHGILPDGDYDSDSDTKILYCCNDQGDWKQSIDLPVHEPFYLLPHQSDNCQRVKGALSTLEYIAYDTEEDNNHDNFHKSHAYTTGEKGQPRVYYCYYKDCEYKLDSTSESFGAENYPAHQHCSWNITVKNGLQVFLEFTKLDIPDCLENRLEIYDGGDSTAVLLATYCAGNATSGNTLRSTGKNAYVRFKSGKDSTGSLQFQARYKAVKPTTDPEWPSGTYGLPKTRDSCPVGWVQGSRTQHLESSARSFQTAFSTQFDMDAVINQAEHYIQRKFCMKTFRNDNDTLWPAGSYCIYKKNACPTGMTDGSVYWDDEDADNKNTKSGILPDGQYDRDTKIYYCCVDKRNWYDPIELPVSVPMFLLPHQSKKCQRVKWTMSNLQFITYDTEDDQNRDNFKGSHVYAENKDKALPTTIYYCYYEGCQYHINGESSSYISIAKSPTQDFQYCSWLLSVRYGNISLIFNTMFIPECSKDNFIKIFDGPTSQSPLLEKYCGREVVRTISITSEGKHLFVLVKSGSNGQMGTTVAFYATFKNNLPFGITVRPPTNVMTPSTRSWSMLTTFPTLSTLAKDSSTSSFVTLETKPLTKSSTKSTLTTSTKSPTTSTYFDITSQTKPLTKSSTKSPLTTSTKSPMRSTDSAITSQTKPPTKLSIQFSERSTQALQTSQTTTVIQVPFSTLARSVGTFTTVVELSTQPDETPATSRPPHLTDLPHDLGIEKATEPDITTVSTHGKKPQTTVDTLPHQSTGDGNSSTPLIIVIPVCITFVLAVLIVMIFFRRRNKSDSSHESRNGENQHSNRNYDARYCSPDKVSILQTGGQQMNNSSGETDNPLYEGNNTFYCTIPEKKQYRQEIGLENQTSQSSLYERPFENIPGSASCPTLTPPNLPPRDGICTTLVNQGASTSSCLLSNCSDNQTNIYEQPDTQIGDSETPTERLSTASGSVFVRPRRDYETPVRSYESHTRKDAQNSPYDITPVQSTNAPRRSLHRNVAKGNDNAPYQIPTNNAASDIGEIMHGENNVVDNLQNTGISKC